uniref:VWFA domain-containing protein n=1 Tax=Acrobeloides nanus TaxID=290746 RepID=A0A914E0W5_9BILA
MIKVLLFLFFGKALCQTTLTPTSSQTPYFQNNPTTSSPQDYDQTDVSNSQYNNQNSQQQLLNSNQNNQQSSQYPGQGYQQQYGNQVNQEQYGNQVNQQQFPSEYNQNQISNGAQDQYSASGNQQSILSDFGPTVSPDSQNFVVMNPNARFLPENLYDQYVTAYNQQRFYNPTIPTTTQPPILSNSQQNQVNYQNILNQPQSSTPLYTNNIYGYDYRSNPNQQYTYIGNNQQYQPPVITRYQPPQGSPFGRKRRSVTKTQKGNSTENDGNSTDTAPIVVFAFVENASFEPEADNSTENSNESNFSTEVDSTNTPPNTARWMDQPSAQTRKKRLNGIGTFTLQEPMYDPATNAAYQASHGGGAGGQYQGQPFYNPPSQNYQYNPSGSSGIQLYSGSSSTYNAPQYNYPNPQVYAGAPVVNPNSPNYQQVLQQDQQALQAYQDPNCSGQDPYWCAQYVQDFLNGLVQYDQTPQQAACQQLVSSLQFSDNRCCQAVRANGSSPQNIETSNVEIPNVEIPNVETPNGETINCTTGSVDIVFVNDQSGSVGFGNFGTAVDSIINFVQKLKIGPRDSHVGLVFYDAMSKVIIGLGTYEEKEALVEAIDHSAILYSGGGTNISAGMYAATFEVFGGNGDRPDIPNVMIIMTDGQDKSNVTQQHDTDFGDITKILGQVCKAIAVKVAPPEPTTTTTTTLAPTMPMLAFDLRSENREEDAVPAESNAFATPCAHNISNAWLDIVIVLDVTAAMGTEDLSTFGYMIYGLLMKTNPDLSNNHSSRVAFIVYNSAATIISGFTDIQSLRPILFSVEQYHSSDTVENIRAGLRAANELIKTQKSYRRPVVILAAASFNKSPDSNPTVVARQMNESGIFIMTINFQPSEGTIIEGLRSISRPNMAFSSVNMETLGADLQYGLTTANCICPEGKNQYYALQFQTWDDDRVEYYADCFYPSKNPLFTGLASESCKAHGGVLVKITSKAQFEFIQSM